MEINKQKAGLTLGGLLGLWHLVWALLVAVGLAQSLMNFILRLHFLQYPYSVLPFRLGSAALLIIVTSLIGYCFGWAFAAIWNHLQKGKM